MLQRCLAPLLIGGAATIDGQFKERGVERHPFTEPNKVDIHLCFALIARDHDTELRQAVDDVQAVEDAVVVPRGLKNGNLRNAITVVLPVRWTFHLYS